MLFHGSFAGLALPLLLVLAGCRADVIEPSSGPGSVLPAARPPASQPPIPAQSGGMNRDGQPLAGRAPARASLSLERIEGADLARARTIFAPVERRLEPCGRTGSGPLLVRITRREDRTQLSLDPAGGLDRDGRRCVLSALSTLDYDGVLDKGEPGGRPSGWSAQVRIEW
jgi:hypothetical protein